VVKADPLERHAMLEDARLRNHMISLTGYERDSAISSVVERDRERLRL
jgi:hypothetical protein